MAVKVDCLACVDLLLLYGADVNVYARLGHKYTPLMNAVTNRQLDIVSRLLDEPTIDVNKKDGDCILTALILAFPIRYTHVCSRDAEPEYRAVRIAMA